MIIKILGGGCRNCDLLAENAKNAVTELQIDAEIKKITDFRDILKYDIMATPALVVNENLVSSGKVLKTQQIIETLKGFLCNESAHK